MSIDVLGALPDVDPLLWSHGSSISWICISVASASPTMKERLESRASQENVPLQSSSRQTLLKMVFIFVVICQMRGASCCGCVNCGIQLLPLKNRSELVWGISQCENFQGSWTIFLLLVCIWGGLYLKQKDGNEQSGTPGPVIHYSLVFVYSIGIGTWFLFMTDVQLCKIDSEGKARKVVGYSCVVVKVNWGYMAWF